MFTYTTSARKPSWRKTHLIRAGELLAICSCQPERGRVVDVPYDEIRGGTYPFVKWCGQCLRIDAQERAA